MAPTIPVVWHCDECPQPVVLTVKTRPVEGGYRVEVGHHIRVHLVQHR